MLVPQNRRGTFVLRDERDSEHPKVHLIDIIKLNDTYKSQPRNNDGTYIHTAPADRIHADVYLGPHAKVEVEVQVTTSVALSGALVSGTCIPMESGQVFGFAGSVTGVSGTAGTVGAILTDSGLFLSSSDVVGGTVFVGSVASASESPFFLSGL